jgi:putative endonuclease
MNEYFVYMVRCLDGSYYTGVTNDVKRRVWEHNEGKDQDAYIFKRRPVELVYSACFDDIQYAIAWEKKVKRWTRKKKEVLIRGEYEELPKLSQRQTPYKKSPRMSS